MVARHYYKVGDLVQVTGENLLLNRGDLLQVVYVSHSYDSVACKCVFSGSCHGDVIVHIKNIIPYTKGEE